MIAWSGFWVGVIYVGVAIFAVLSLWVIVAGYGDIKRMFADLRAQQDSNSGDDVT